MLGVQSNWPDGGYISIMAGYDIRGEICYADGYNLTVEHTCTVPYIDNFEGQAYDYALEEWHGEEIEPSIYYSRYAYAELENERVVAGSLTVTLKTGKKVFTITDYTDLLVRGEMPIPPLGEVYIVRRGNTAYGGEFRDTQLYFNPAYVGMAFDVEYRSYAERYYVEPFVLDNEIYFNEIGPEAQSWILPTVRRIESLPGLIYKREAGLVPPWVRVSSWPAAPCAVITHGEDLYALASMDSSLMKYGAEWPGYINVDIGGAYPVDVFQVLTETAKAADMYLGEEFGKVKLRHRSASDSIVHQYDCEDFEIADLTAVPSYRAVLVTYGDGKALYPTNAVNTPERLLLSLSMPYVMSYGHALMLAERYYNYYHSGAMIYELTAPRDGLDLPLLGEHITIGDIQGRVLAYSTPAVELESGGVIIGSKLSLSIEKVGERLTIGVA
jgi:hypothetical protein